MKFLTLVCIVLAGLSLSTRSIASEAGILGLWKTSSTEDGYLHVLFENCESRICGIIHSAHSPDGEPDLAHPLVGKKMIWDMKSNGENRWRGGKIWDPTQDKTYKSKMSLSQNSLAVSGCILFFCRAETWTRVIE